MTFRSPNFRKKKNNFIMNEKCRPTATGRELAFLWKTRLDLKLQALKKTANVNNISVKAPDMKTSS